MISTFLSSGKKIKAWIISEDAMSLIISLYSRNICKINMQLFIISSQEKLCFKQAHSLAPLVIHLPWQFLSNIPLPRAWPELSLGLLARLSSLSHSIATVDLRSTGGFSQSTPQGPLHLLRVTHLRVTHLRSSHALSTCPPVPILSLDLAMVWFFPFSNKTNILKYTYHIP